MHAALSYVLSSSERISLMKKTDLDWWVKLAAMPLRNLSLVTSSPMEDGTASISREFLSLKLDTA
jgi:hypothetical protein